MSADPPFCGHNTNGAPKAPFVLSDGTFRDYSSVTL